MKEIRIFQTVNGKEPFSQWLESLDKVSRTKIHAYINRLALGAAKKNVKPVGSGVFELKINWSSGLRIYFGEIENVIILLLLGGDKRTQEKDIKTAKRYWRDHAQKRILR